MARVVIDALILGSMYRLEPIPTGPFLAMAPATTAVARSLAVAPILAGGLGLVVLASRSFGTWLLVPAILILAIIGVGCSRAFLTFWWPLVLGSCLALMAVALVLLPRLTPSTAIIAVDGPPGLDFVFTASVIFAVVLWTSMVTRIATDARNDQAGVAGAQGDEWVAMHATLRLPSARCPGGGRHDAGLEGTDLPGVIAKAGIDPTLAGRALQDALLGAITARGGHCEWIFARSCWVVTLRSPEEQIFYSASLEEGLARCLAWLIAREPGSVHLRG